jgi:hypothetical protein
MAKRPKLGDRVRVTGKLPDDPDPLTIGDEGTVDWLTPAGSHFQQIGVKWDSGRSLLLLPNDPFVVLPGWDVGSPVIDECEECGAPGDVECQFDCDNKDFRDAQFEGVLERVEPD